MKKLLLGCLILLTACHIPTAAPVAPPSLTVTVPPKPTTATVTPGPTAAPAQSPTPEFTTTPFPRFFTDEFDGSLASWAILQAGSDAAPDIKEENSRLLLQMPSPYTWVYALYGAQDYADVRIDTQFMNQAGSPASIGLICRYSETDGWLEYNVSTDGTYNVLYGKWLASGIADYLPITSGPSGAILPSGASQQIGLVCSGTTLKLLVDGNIIRSLNISRYELGEGKVGLAAAAFENVPVIAAFDWIKVSEP